MSMKNAAIDVGGLSLHTAMDGSVTISKPEQAATITIEVHEVLLLYNLLAIIINHAPTVTN